MTATLSDETKLGRFPDGEQRSVNSYALLGSGDESALLCLQQGRGASPANTTAVVVTLTSAN